MRVETTKEVDLSVAKLSPPKAHSFSFSKIKNIDAYLKQKAEKLQDKS